MYNEYYSLGRQILSATADNCVGKAVDFILTHCKDARWDIVSRALNVLEEPVELKPNTSIFCEYILKEANRYFAQDMIYYGINYDHMRL